MSDLLYMLNKYLINEVTKSMAWKMTATGYQEGGKEALNVLPGCYARITRAKASLGTRGRVNVDNEELVGSQQHGTENAQVLQHKSNWWGGGGKEDLIITPYLRRLKYDDYTSTHKHDFKLYKEVILQIITLFCIFELILNSDVKFQQCLISGYTEN